MTESSNASNASINNRHSDNSKNRHSNNSKNRHNEDSYTDSYRVLGTTSDWAP